MAEKSTTAHGIRAQNLSARHRPSAMYHFHMPEPTRLGRPPFPASQKRAGLSIYLTPAERRAARRRASASGQRIAAWARDVVVRAARA